MMQISATNTIWVQFALLLPFLSYKPQLPLSPHPSSARAFPALAHGVPYSGASKPVQAKLQHYHKVIYSAFATLLAQSNLGIMPSSNYFPRINVVYYG